MQEDKYYNSGNQDGERPLREGIYTFEAMFPIVLGIGIIIGLVLSLAGRACAAPGDPFPVVAQEALPCIPATAPKLHTKSYPVPLSNGDQVRINLAQEQQVDRNYRITVIPKANVAIVIDDVGRVWRIPFVVIAGEVQFSGEDLTPINGVSYSALPTGGTGASFDEDLPKKGGKKRQ